MKFKGGEQMNKLNILIDIDGTVTEPFYWLKQANRYFNMNLDPRVIRNYEIHEALGVSSEEGQAFYDMYGESIHQEAKERRGASQIVTRLAEDHSIHFVTAREAKMKQVSEYWLKKHAFPMDSLTLLGSHDKVKSAYSLECDVFIEDRYENAVQLATEGFRVILINCSYNQGPLPKTAIRVNTWEEIGYIINDYARKSLGLAQ